MKKILYLILICFLLVGCSTSTNTKPQIKGDVMNEQVNDVNSKIKIAFIGDSITQGYLSSVPEIYSYPAQLQQMLGDEYEIMNFGVGGSCAISDLDDNNLYSKKAKYYRNTELYKLSVDYDADIVVIMLGLNDRVSVYNDDSKLISEGKESLKFWLADLANEYKDKGAKVYIASSNNNVVEKRAASEWCHGIVQDIQKEVADENNFGYIDIYSIVKDKLDDPIYFNSDRLHPNNDGYKVIADAFYYYINDEKIFD